MNKSDSKNKDASPPREHEVKHFQLKDKTLLCGAHVTSKTQLANWSDNITCKRCKHKFKSNARRLLVEVTALDRACRAIPRT